jgi:phosphoenolpyruvate carboxylase
MAWSSTKSLLFRKHYNAAVRTLWIRIMPTEIHDCHQVWVRDEMARWQASGVLTYDELLHLRTFVGTSKSTRRYSHQVANRPYNLQRSSFCTRRMRAHGKSQTF